MRLSQGFRAGCPFWRLGACLPIWKSIGLGMGQTAGFKFCRFLLDFQTADQGIEIVRDEAGMGKSLDSVPCVVHLYWSPITFISVMDDLS